MYAAAPNTLHFLGENPKFLAHRREGRITHVDDRDEITLVFFGGTPMAGRQGKERIETLAELKKALGTADCEFGLLVRGERKVEMELDAKVIAELLRMLQKVVGNRREEDEY